jgi:glutamine phosphoribosylpyrophosphate amidotransferase
MQQVSDETTSATLQGHVAIGPTYPSTAGTSCWENAQPAIKLNAGGGMAAAHNGDLTSTATLAGQLIPQESSSSRPVQPRPTSDPDVPPHLLDREADLSLLASRPRLVDLTRNAVLARVGPIRGPCAAWGTGIHPIPRPDAGVATLRPFVTTQPVILPLPNREPEVAR